MKTKAFIAFLLLITQAANARPKRTKTIYGIDNRQEIYQVLNPQYKNLSKSVAALIPKSQLRPIGNQFEIQSSETLAEAQNLCQEEAFYEQNIVTDATGFLISDDLLVTAEHAMGITASDIQYTCRHYVWVFDVAIHSPGENWQMVEQDQVYECEEVISLNKENDFDYAVIKLKTKVTNRSPLNLARTSPNIGTEVALLGHPSGLALKWASDAFIINIIPELSQLVLNTDSFAGNSGSPIINQVSLEVEGLLVGGGLDYLPSINNPSCNKAQVNCQFNGQDCLAGEEIAISSSVLLPYLE